MPTEKTAVHGGDGRTMPGLPGDIVDRIVHLREANKAVEAVTAPRSDTPKRHATAWLWNTLDQGGVSAPSPPDAWT